MISDPLTRNAQEKRLVEMRGEWLRAGKSSEPLDRREVRAITARLYKRIGKPAPKVLFFSSPPMCLLAWAALTELQPETIPQRLNASFQELWRQLAEQLDAQVRPRSRCVLRAGLSCGLASVLREQKRLFFGALETSVRLQLETSFRDGLSWWHEVTDGWFSQAGPLPSAKEQLQRQLVVDIRKQGGYLRSAFDNCFTPDPFSRWETLYSFCPHLLGVRYLKAQSALLDLYLRCARQLHWWFPFDGVVLASERHSLPSVDHRGRLHAADDLAFAYPDGWGLAAWQGIPIPGQYAHPTAHEVLAEPNAELRRVLAERFDSAHGKGAFIQDCGARVIDSAVQPMRPGEPDMINELLSIDLPGDAERHMTCLKVIDPSTGRTYIIRVPPVMRTVREALAWSFNLDAEDYVLEQES
jgi:hypothetical protein